MALPKVGFGALLFAPNRRFMVLRGGKLGEETGRWSCTVAQERIINRDNAS